MVAKRLLVLLLALALGLTSCVTHTTVLQAAPEPALAFPSLRPSGAVSCSPRRSLTDQCVWTL
jgi:hypothetical protein